MTGRAVYELIGPDGDHGAAIRALAEASLANYAQLCPGTSPDLTAERFMADAEWALQPAFAAASHGHAVELDPGMSGRRWTCTECGRAARRVSAAGPLYGSALAGPCPGKAEG
jgi:hypothetical protein